MALLLCLFRALQVTFYLIQDLLGASVGQVHTDKFSIQRQRSTSILARQIAYRCDVVSTISYWI